MLSYAILIDGGFVRSKLGSGRAPLDAARIESLIKWISSHDPLRDARLHRVYFYDAKPLQVKVQKPLGGGLVDFSKSPLSSGNRALHAGLSDVPFVSIRMGELHFGGWKVDRRALNQAGNAVNVSAADLRPEVRQKGVDMRIGLDIAALTLKAHVKIIVLVTGDSDFVPAMKFARREGAQLLLFTLGHGVYATMREHSDLLVPDLPPSPPAQPARSTIQATAQPPAQPGAPGPATSLPS